MNDEISEKIEEILQNGNAGKSYEAVSLTLSLQDEEDRLWFLFKIVGWFIENGDWRKAYGIAQLMDESYEKSDALRLIAEKLASDGHLERSIFIFAEAENSSISENLADWQKAELLHKIAKSLLEIKAIYRANEVWKKAISIAQAGENSQNIQDSLDSSSVLAEIAESYGADGKIESALELAQKIKNIGKRERAINKITKVSQQIKKVA